MKDEAFIKAPFVRRAVNNFTLHEEKLIEAAEQPLWLPVSDEILWETRAKLRQNRKVLIQGVGIALAVMVAGFLLGAKKYAIAVGITAIVFAIAAVIFHLRSKIDETAVMAELPIDRIESGTRGNYAVCYLPDGRYELRVTGDTSYANTLVIVKYKKMTTWQAMFIRHADDKPLPSTLGIEDEETPADEPLPDEADAGAEESDEEFEDAESENDDETESD